MKNFFVGLTAALVGMQLGACVQEKEPVQMAEREYVKRTNQFSVFIGIKLTPRLIEYHPRTDTGAVV